MTYRVLHGDYINGKANTCAVCGKVLGKATVEGTDSYGRYVYYCTTKCKKAADREFNAFCEALDAAEWG